MDDSLAGTFRGNFLSFMGLAQSVPTAPASTGNIDNVGDDFELPFLTGGEFYVPPAEASPFTQILISYGLLTPGAKRKRKAKSKAKSKGHAASDVEMDSFTAPSTSTVPSSQSVPDYSVPAAVTTTTTDAAPHPPQPRGKGAGRGTRTKEGAPKYVEDITLLKERKKKKKKVKYVVHRDGTRERLKEEKEEKEEESAAAYEHAREAAEAEKAQRIKALKARRQEALAKSAAKKPYFTISVTLLEIALFILELAKTAKISSISFGSNVWQWGGVSTVVVIDMGGKVASRIVELNEWWRFVTPIFLHVSLTHIVFNLIMQVKVGMDLEKSFGSIRLFILYMLCGIGGNLVSSCFLYSQIQAGASGSLFGLLGLMLVDVFSNWHQLRKPVVNLVVVIITILLSIVSGMMPGVDNFAHVGGLIVGLVGGFALIPHLVKGNKRCCRFCVVIITFPLLIAEMGILFWLFYGYVAQGNDIECEWCEEINCAKAIMGEDWCNG